MNDRNVMLQRERLSALADGELHEADLPSALGYAATEEGQACWQTYQLIGEALRRSEATAGVGAGQHSDAGSALLTSLRARMAQEAPAPLPAPALHLTPAVLQPLAEPLAAPAAGRRSGARDPAANTEVWRWKMVAGCASLATVAVLGWHTFAGLDGAAPQGAQLAAAPAVAAPAPGAAAGQAGATVTAATATVPGAAAPQVMLRDPRLDELLAAHRQLGHSTTALQMPADFLRNASFAGRER